MRSSASSGRSQVAGPEEGQPPSEWRFAGTTIASYRACNISGTQGTLSGRRVQGAGRDGVVVSGPRLLSSPWNRKFSHHGVSCAKAGEARPRGQAADRKNARSDASTHPPRHGQTCQDHPFVQCPCLLRLQWLIHRATLSLAKSEPGTTGVDCDDPLFPWARPACATSIPTEHRYGQTKTVH